MFISLVILFSCCVFYLSDNISNYSKWTVITDVKTKNVDSLTFPAVTFCLTKNWTDNEFETFELNDQLIALCLFDLKKCKIEDFEKIPFWFHDNDFRTEINCYRFNSGRDSFGNRRKLFKTTHIGIGQFRLLINMTSGSYINFYVDHNNDKPSEEKLVNYLYPDTYVRTEIQKTIDEKLPEPYNPCLDKESINKFESKLVKEIIENDYDYRQLNCYDLCYQKFIESLAGLRNISLLEAFQNTSNFNRKENCDNFCPLECDSVNYETSEIERVLIEEDFDYYIETFLNNSNDYKKENLLVLRIEYSELKYTQISQTAKMTATDLISNIGGVLGVFLELSFYSAYLIFEKLIHFNS